MEPFTINWCIKTPQNKSQSSQYCVFQDIKARLVFEPPKQNRNANFFIKFQGIKGKSFLCQYSFKLENSDPNNAFIDENKKLFSTAKAYVDIKTPLDESKIQSFLIDNELRVICSFVCTEKTNRTPDLRARRHIIRTRTDGDVSYTKDASPKNVYNGYVGLRNQGATCYMNSYLQALFHLPAFRRIIYNMPTTGTEDLTKSIPINLQILFYYMQFSKEPVSTNNLTRSFGWDSYEVAMQQDVQEFSRVLIENLERKLKGTDLEESIANLFKGTAKRYIYCPQVNYRTEKEETFYDISLDINFQTLQESIESLIQPEKLDDKYDTGDEKMGKQDAEMGLEFVNLPPVLFLHLKRFQYDKYYRITKVNKKFEFPKELNLEKLLNNEEEKKSAIYELTGVLVHSGSVSSGHYYAYLRTTAEDKWFQFNDSTVTIEDEKSAIENNYGSDSHTMSGYSAYYLIYSQKDAIPQLFRPVSDEEVPEHIKAYVQQLDEIRKREKEEQAEKSKYLAITITQEDSLKEICANCQFGFGSYQYYTKDPELKAQNPDAIIRFEITKESTFEDLYKMACEKIGASLDSIRLWRSGAFNIPNVQIPYSTATLQSICSNYTKEMSLFMQKKPIDEKVNVEGSERVVYVKYYFKEHNIIQFISSLLVNENETLDSISHHVNRIVGFPEDTQLLAFQETTSHSAKKLNSAETISSLLIENGDIIIFQQPPNDDQLQPTIPLFDMKLPPKAKLSAFDLLPELRTGLVSSFIEEYFLQHTCTFNDYNQPSKELCTFAFPISITYDALKVAISRASQINYDPNTMGMVLFPTDPMELSGPSTYPIDTNGKPIQTIDRNTKTLFVKYIEGIPDAQVKKMVYYDVIFSSNSVTIDFEEMVLAKKNSTPMHLLDLLRQKHEEIPKEGPFRVVEMIRSQFGLRLGQDEEIKNPYIPIRIEKIPSEQVAYETWIQKQETSIYKAKAKSPEDGQNNTDVEQLDVKCVPCSKCFYDEFGSLRYVDVPFILSVRKEAFVETKKRIFEIWGDSIPKDAKIEVRDGPVLELTDEESLFDKISISTYVLVIVEKPPEQKEEKDRDLSSQRVRNYGYSNPYGRQVGVHIHN